MKDRLSLITSLLQWAKNIRGRWERDAAVMNGSKCLLTYTGGQEEGEKEEFKRGRTEGKNNMARKNREKTEDITILNIITEN